MIAPVARPASGPADLDNRTRQILRRAAEHEAAQAVQLRVPRYFFDTRDADAFIEDDVGLELPDLQSAKAEAARSLAELARDVLPGSEKRTLVVEVRDEHQPLLKATMIFEAIVFAT